jgi:hypothetical protein
MVLNAIYEEDFLGFSYGFRPGRGPHDALEALYVGIDSRKVNGIPPIRKIIFIPLSTLANVPTISSPARDPLIGFMAAHYSATS